MTDIDRRDPQGHLVPLPESARTVALTATVVGPHQCPDIREPFTLWRMRTQANALTAAVLFGAGFLTAWLVLLGQQWMPVFGSAFVAAITGAALLAWTVTYRFAYRRWLAQVGAR